MMRPPPRSVMDGTTACAQSNGPRRLTLITRSHSAVGMSARPKRGRSVMIAALLIRMSTPPNASVAAAAIACADSARVTSTATPIALAPLLDASSSAARSAASALTSASTTAAPTSARARP